MKDLILQNVKQFLDRHYKSGQPILLGCSGGPDSLALLHLLIDCLQFFPLSIHVAHIDHGWRAESRAEAERLMAHVQEFNLPFHLHILEKGEAASELDARMARLKFFNSLYQKLDCQALVLAHQGDDQAETVLKRILEGASLYALGGIRPSTAFQNMQIWRPLLKVQKKDILQWLEKRNLKSVDDPTNADPKYLRSRMRVKILPDLEESFGKAVSANLIRFGDLADEIKEYLIRKSPLFSIEKREEMIDLNPYYPIDSFELKIFLKHFLAAEDIFLSHQEISTLQELIEENVVNKRVNSVIVRNRCLFLMKNSNK